MTAPPHRGVLGRMALLATVALTGCGIPGLSDDEPVNPPAPLVELPERLRIEPVWQRDVGADADERDLRLTVAVDGSRAFAADRKGRVSAFLLATGEPLWSTDVDLDLGGGPGAGAGLVVVGATEGTVVALDQADGVERWRGTAPSEVLAPPGVATDRVAVRVGDGSLVVLDAIDGSLAWTYEHPVPALSLRGTSSPLMVPGAVIAGFDNGRLTALDPENGQIFWEQRIAEPRGRSELERMVDIDADPVLRDTRLYVVSFQGRLAAMDLFSGELQWQREMSSHAGIGADDDAVYVTDEQSHVWALDARSGGTLWKQAAMSYRGLTAPTSDGRHVVVGDAEGYVHVLDRDDGSIVGRGRVDGDGIAEAPVLAGDLVLVYGRGGSLSALRLPK